MSAPTFPKRVTLRAHYGAGTAVVVAQRWPNGDCWISARQMRAAERRAGLATGDHLDHRGGGAREGYLVEVAA